MVSKQKNTDTMMISQLRNIDAQQYLRVGFALFTVLVLVLVWTTFATYNAHHETKGVFSFAAKHHVLIMIISFTIILFYGFFVSKMLYAQLITEKKDSGDLLKLVLDFLSEDERKVVRHLVETRGKTTQAEVSRLQGLTRLKAHRVLQKLSSKGLIEVVPHGKIRKVYLRSALLEKLTELENRH